MRSNIPAHVTWTLLALLIAVIGIVSPLNTAKEDTGMVRRIAEQTGMKESKAESIVRVLNQAGFQDADGFELNTTPDERSHTLRFMSGGHTFTLELSRYMLCQRITDEDGNTVYALIY